MVNYLSWCRRLTDHCGPSYVVNPTIFLDIKGSTAIAKPTDRQLLAQFWFFKKIFEVFSYEHEKKFPALHSAEMKYIDKVRPKGSKIFFIVIRRLLRDFY